MDYYPVMLNLKNKNVLIIGAGNIAHRKLKGLLEYECHITIISKKIDDQILELKKASVNKEILGNKDTSGNEKISANEKTSGNKESSIIKEDSGDAQVKVKVLSFVLIKMNADIHNIQDYIKNADLLFICTDNTALNEQIELQAKKNKVWFLRCDCAVSSDFINPIVISKGEVKIAVSTSGKSPAYSKILKQKIIEITEDIDSDHIKLLGEARQAVKTSYNNSKQKKEILSKLHLMGKDELIEIIGKEKS